MSQFGWPRCPDRLRGQLDDLLAALQATLAANLTGVYLHGSLAMGCFNPQRSDLDLLAVTQTRMDTATKRRVAEHLLALSTRPAAIEISFLAAADLHPWQYPTPFDFHYSESWRTKLAAQIADRGRPQGDALPRHDPDLAAHISVLRERGICLVGPPIADIFPAVPRAHYLASLRQDVLSAEFGLAADSAPPVYAVLNGCRTYAYLTEGRILSKDEGGVWALQHLPRIYREPIQAALHAYRHGRDDDPLEPAAAHALAGYLQEQIEPLLLATA